MFDYIYNHINDTLEHFSICLKINNILCFRIVAVFLDSIGIDISNYLVRQGNGVIFDTMLHKAAKAGNVLILQYFLHLFLEKKLSLNSQAIYQSRHTPIEIASNAECAEEIRKAIEVISLV